MRRSTLVPAMRAFLAGCALSLLACGARQITVAEEAPPSPESTAPPAADSDSERTARTCDLPPGLHGSGAFEVAAPPELDEAAGTFITDGPYIMVELPMGPGENVSIRIYRDSSMPRLPEAVDLSALPDDGDAWRVTVELAWCNDRECRIDFYAGSREPTDRLQGWLAFEGALFSDLSRVTACVTAADDDQRTLTVNAVAVRAVH